MRSIWSGAVLAMVAAGCHCGKQPLNQQGPQFTVTQPTTHDADGGLVLDFGTVIEPGNYSGSIALDDIGVLPGNVLSATLRAGSDPAFSLATATYPAPVKAGTTYTITVNYAPTTTAHALGYVDLTTDDSRLPNVAVKLIAASVSDQALVCVDGTGDGGWQCNTPSAPPLIIDFGTVLVGAPVVSRRVQVRDVGTGSLQYYGTAFGATTSLAYSMVPLQTVPAGGETIDAGSQLEFAITFQPTAPGQEQGVASVNTTDSAHPRVDIQLTAHAVVSMNCELQAAPTPVDFGSVPNNAPADQTLVIVNVGATPCHIATLPLTGSAAFSLPSPPVLPDAVLANGVVTLDVRYTPTGTNVDQGTVTINSDDPVNPAIAVPLRATSIAPPPCVISAVPGSLDFGALTPGAHLSKNLLVEPTGADVCVVTSAKIRQGDPAYKVSAALPVTLVQVDAGNPLFPSTATFAVTYGPTAPGTDNDTLDITYFAGSFTPYKTSVPLHGLAGQQQLCVIPKALHYGAVPVGQNKDLAFGMTACGNTTVHISSITIEDAGTPFTFTPPAPTFPEVIALGTTTDQSIRFAPPTSSPYAARAHIVSDDPVFPDQYVALDTQPETACVLKITPIAVNFGTLQANQVTQKSVVLTNVGSGVCHLTNFTLALGGAAGFALIAPPSTLDIPFGKSSPPLVVQANLPPGNPTVRHGKVTFQSNDLSQPTVAIALIAYLPTTGPYAQGWPKLYSDNSNTSRTTSDTSTVTGKELWTFTMPPEGTSFGPNPCPTYQQSPAVGPEGTVYQVDVEGTLNALAPDGTLLWQYVSLAPAGVDPFGATPFIAADNTIYFASGSEGTAQPDVFHISNAGALIAKGFTPPDAGADGFDGAPLLSSQGRLFIFDDFPGMLVMDPTTLVLQESAAVNYGNERGSFALAPDDTSFWNFGSLAQRVTPPAPPGGGLKVAWSWPPAGTQPFGGAAAVGGSVTVDSTAGRVYLSAGFVKALTTMSTGVTAVDINTGAVLWSVLLPGVPATPNVLPLTISVLWTTDVGNVAASIGADGTLYVGNGDGMYALDGATGAVKPGWPYKTTSAVTGTASLGGDGALFFGTMDGTFYALNSDGTLRFKQLTGGRISSSPAIGPDGTVYFVSDDGLLHAIH